MCYITAEGSTTLQTMLLCKCNIVNFERSHFVLFMLHCDVCWVFCCVSFIVYYNSLLIIDSCQYLTNNGIYEFLNNIDVRHWYVEILVYKNVRFLKTVYFRRLQRFMFTMLLDTYCYNGLLDRCRCETWMLFPSEDEPRGLKALMEV